MKETTRDFKVGRAYDDVDWDSVKKKYKKIPKKIVSSAAPVKDECFHI